MSLSEDKKSEYLESLCSIHAEKKNKVGEWHSGFGNGVFITPSHVLTAWHVITGSPASRVEFGNHLGDTALMLNGGFKKRDVESDLCIIELDKPIGKDFFVRPINRHMDIEKRTKGDKRIGTVFANNVVGNKQVIDDVNMKSFYNAFSIKSINAHGVDKAAMPNYTLKHSQVHEGHSGAPVIDDNGFIMSIITMVLMAEKKDGLNYSNTFKGANPKKVADFSDSFLFSPESVHQPDPESKNSLDV